MTRSREEFAHFAETVTGSSARLAWLLTGDATRAKGLVRAALARTYVDWPHLHDDFARGQRTREVLLRNAIHDPEPFVPLATDRLARLGQLSPRDRAIAVLRHGFELPEAAVAELVGCSRGAVRTVAHDTHDLRGGLRDADAPPELGRFDPAEAAAEGERLRTTSSRRETAASTATGFGCRCMQAAQRSKCPMRAASRTPTATPSTRQRLRHTPSCRPLPSLRRRRPKKR